MYTNILNPESIENCILNLLPTHVVLMNTDGSILFANDSWLNFSKNTECIIKKSTVGDNLFQNLKLAIINQDDNALHLLLGIQRIVKGEAEQFETILKCDENEKAEWFNLTCSKNKNNDYSLVIVCENYTRAKQARLQARELEDNLQRHLQNSQNGIVVFDENYKVIEYNDASLQLTGIESSEIQHMHMHTLFQNGGTFEQILEELKTTGGITAELKLTNTFKKLCYVEASISRFTDAYRKNRYLAIFHDVSQRKKIQKELLHEKQFTEHIIDSIPGIFFVSDIKGNILRCNANMMQRLTIDKLKAGQLNTLQLLHPDEHPHLTDTLRKVIKFGSGEAVLQLQLPGNQKPYFHFQVKKFNSGKKTLFACTGIDITSQKKAEEDKKLQEHLLEQLFENSPIGMVLVNKEYGVIKINESFSSIFGYDEADIINKNIDQTIIPKYLEEEAQLISNDTFAGKITQVETIRKRKDGTDIPVVIGSVPVIHNEELVAIYGMYVDISEQKKMEGQIKLLLEHESVARAKAELAVSKLEEMFMQTPSAMAILEGHDFRFIFANDTCRSMVLQDDLLRQPLFEALPELEAQGYLDIMLEMLESKTAYIASERPVSFLNPSTGESTGRILNFVLKPILNEQGDVLHVLVQAIDVTEQVQSREQISRALKVKETLLSELHHRVKNNLAVMSGLLELQRFETENAIVKEELGVAKSRIHTVADIHEILYKSENLNEVPLKDMLRKIIGHSSNQNAGNVADISLETCDNDFTININQAIPLGLYVNELEQLVLGFSGKSESRALHFRCNCSPEKVEITALIEHIDISALLNTTHCASISLLLLNTLTEQIGGSISIDEEKHLIQLEFQLTGKNGSAGNAVLIN